MQNYNLIKLNPFPPTFSLFALALNRKLFWLAKAKILQLNNFLKFSFAWTVMVGQWMRQHVDVQLTAPLLLKEAWRRRRWRRRYKYRGGPLECTVPAALCITNNAAFRQLHTICLSWWVYERSYWRCTTINKPEL